MIPPEIDEPLEDLRDYLPHDEDRYPSTDVREKDCLGMIYSCSKGTVQSLRIGDHMVRDLLRYLLSPGIGSLTSEEEIAQVIIQNQFEVERQLSEAQDGLRDTKI